MRKNFTFLIVAVLALLGFSQKSFAQDNLVSTKENPKWFVLKVQATDSRAGRVIANDPTDANKIIKSFDASAITGPNDKIVWRVEMADDGTVALINKFDGSSINPTLLYNETVKDSVVVGSAANTTIFGWEPVPVNESEMVYLFNHSTVDAEGNAKVTTINMMNYGIMGFVSYDDLTDPASQFKAIPAIDFYKSMFKTSLDAVATSLTNAVAGTGLGQYPAAAITTMTNAYNTALAVYNDANTTDTQAFAAKATLLVAFKVFEDSKNTVYSTTDSPKWLVFQVQTTGTDKRVGRVFSFDEAGYKIISVSSTGLTQSDNVLFRIEKNPSTGYCALINKVSDAYLSTFGDCAEDPTFVWTLKDLTNNIFMFQKDNTYLNMKNTTDWGFTSWSSTTDKASQFKAFLPSVFFSTGTGLNAAETSSVKVSVQNNKIVVLGTDAPVKVYTISGIEVDAAKTLTQGIYIVKVDGTTTKVVIK